jgi:hypothetical protein
MQNITEITFAPSTFTTYVWYVCIEGAIHIASPLVTSHDEGIRISLLCHYSDTNAYPSRGLPDEL